MPQPRPARNPGPPLLAILLMLALAVTFALLIKGNHPYFAAPVTTPPATATPEATGAVPTADMFPQRVREQVPGLNPDITDEQIVAEALAVCEDIAARGAADVYYTRETPTETPEDAAKFFWASVTEKCPALAEDLVNVMTGAPE